MVFSMWKVLALETVNLYVLLLKQKNKSQICTWKEPVYLYGNDHALASEVYFCKVCKWHISWYQHSSHLFIFPLTFIRRFFAQFFHHIVSAVKVC